MNCQKCGNPLPGGAKFCPNCGEPAPASPKTASRRLDFSEYIADRTRDFTGREWVFEKLNGWLEKNEKRFCWLSGGPGSGKTALAARLVQVSSGEANAVSSSLARGCLAHYHFCRAFNEETLNPLAFVRNLSLGLAGRYPVYAQALAKVQAQGVTINFDVDQKIGSIQPGGTAQGVVINNLQISGLSARLAFDQLVRQPLQALCDSDFKETVLILVDSLDEALTYDPQENISYLLAQYTDDPDDLPPPVRLLLTGRPDPRLKARFGQPDLDLVDLAPDNLDDVRRYAAARLKDAPDPPRTELVSQISAASRGNFLYTRYVIDDLLGRPQLPADLGQIELPDGLESIYRGFIRRELAASDENWEDRYRPLLGFLAAAGAPGLTRDHLAAVSRLKPSKVDDLLKACAQYLAGSLPAGPFTLYHQSFRDFLVTDAEYPIYPVEADQTLGEFFAAAYQGAWAKCDDEFALTYTPIHLQRAATALSGPLHQAGRNRLLATLIALLSDLAYLQARLVLKAGNPISLERDFIRTLELLPAQEDRSLLEMLLGALRRESHVLHGEPSTLYIQLYNRLWRGDRGRVDVLLEGSQARPTGPWLRAMHPLPVEIALQRTLSGHTETTPAAILIRDDRQIISGSWDGTVRIWDLESGQMLHRWVAGLKSVKDGTEEISAVDALAASADGRRVVTGDMDGNLQVWDGERRVLLYKLPLRGENPALTPDGRGLLLTQGADILLWDLEAQREVRRWKVGKERGSVLLATPDGRWVLAGTGSGRVLRWSLDWPAAPAGPAKGDASAASEGESREKSARPRTARPPGLQVLREIHKDRDGTFEEVSALAVNPEQSLLAAVDMAGFICLIDLQSAGVLLDRQFDDDGYRAVALSTQSGFLVAGGVSGTVQVFRVESPDRLERRTALRGHTGQVMGLRLTRDGRRAVSAGGEGTVRLWDLDAGLASARSKGHETAVTTVAFSPDGRLALSGDEKGQVLLWDVDAGQVLETRAAHGGKVTLLDFDGDTRYLTGSEDGQLCVWQVGQKAPLDQRSDQGDFDFAFLSTARSTTVGQAGGRLALSAHWQEGIHVWDTAQPEPVRVYRAAGVRTAAFAAGGQSLLLGGDRVEMVPLKDGGEPLLLAGPSTSPEVVRISPSGGFAAAGDIEGRLWVWDLQGPAEPRQLVGHFKYIHALSFSPDGRWLVAGGWDGVLRLWSVENGREVSRYAWELPLEAADMAVRGDVMRLAVGDKQGNVLFFEL